MTRLTNRIEANLLGKRKDFPLRTVAGYNWLQHLGMAAIFVDRKDAAGAWHHCMSSARSFVASLQLEARDGERQWFHLSEPAVFDAMRRYMLPTRRPHYDLFLDVFERFRVNADHLMSEVEPRMAKLCSLEDFSLLANVYLNAVKRMPSGVGVYFVHDKGNPSFTDVVVHAPNGFRRFIGNIKGAEGSEIMADVSSYYTVLMSQRHAGNLELFPEELEKIEASLVALVDGVRDEVVAAELSQALDELDGCQTPRISVGYGT